MNESTQKRQIQRFLRGNDKRDVDAFTIYQWIERCHSQEWWGLAMELSPYIPPGSLKAEYQKRLEVLLKECRIKRDKTKDERSQGPITYPCISDRQPIRKIVHPPGSVLGAHPFGKDLQFENTAKQTLRQIYSVIYYMQKNHDFVDAVRLTKDIFNITYNSVDDKCARCFAGSVDTFQRWYVNGEILQKLVNHFHLSYHDSKYFEELLAKN